MAHCWMQHSMMLHTKAVSSNLQTLTRAVCAWMGNFQIHFKSGIGALSVTDNET